MPRTPVHQLLCVCECMRVCVRSIRRRRRLLFDRNFPFICIINFHMAACNFYTYEHYTVQRRRR
jgi:hypothetical protein